MPKFANSVFSLPVSVEIFGPIFFDRADDKRITQNPYHSKPELDLFYE